MYTVTGFANRWGRTESNRPGISGKPARARALLLVTSGGVFWIVAVGPENTAMRFDMIFPLVLNDEFDNEPERFAEVT